MKRKKGCSNSRLYITENWLEENVWFARTDIEQFARIKLTSDWEVFIYPFKITMRFPTLTESIGYIEFTFKKYWREKYEIHNCN